MLAFIKEQAGSEAAAAKVKPDSEGIGYQKRGRQTARTKGWVDQIVEQQAAERASGAPSNAAALRLLDGEVSALPGDAPRRLSG